MKSSPHKTPGEVAAQVKVKSDTILEALFNDLKDGDEDSEDSEEDSNESGEESEADEDEEERKRRKKAKKKEKKRKKKKKKEHKRKRKHYYTDEEEDHQNDRDLDLRKVRKLDEGHRSHHDDRRHDSNHRRERSPVWYPGDDRLAMRRESNNKMGFDMHEERRMRDREREREDRMRRERYEKELRDREDERRREEARRLEDERRRNDERLRRNEEERRRNEDRRRRMMEEDHNRRRDEDRRRYEDEDRRRRRDRERSGSRSNHERPPVRKDDDTFWDSTWDAMQLQKKADDKERRGKHFLDEDRRKRRDNKDGTPSLSPSPERSKKRRERTPSPETEELQRLRKLKAIQDLAVNDDEKFVKDPPNRDDFTYDHKTKMFIRKIKPMLEYKGKSKSPEPSTSGATRLDNDEDKSYDELLKARMSEQVKEGKRDSIDEKAEDNDDKKDGEKKTLSKEAIEELRKKREKFKKEKEKEKEEGEIDDSKDKKKSSRDKEDGEVNSDDERDRRRRREERDRDRRDRGSSSRRSRSRDRMRPRRSRSRSRDRYMRRSPPPPRGGHSFRDRDRRRGRSRSPQFRRIRRSRSRSPRPRDGFRASRKEIDKEKLLAIARKNAVKLLSSDNLMGIDHGRLLSIKAGGQSLGQLTDFCRELARKGITDDFGDAEDLITQRPYNSGDEDDGEFRHPFLVKDRPVPTPFSLSGGPGSSLAPSGAAIEYLTPAAKAAAKTHRMLEFPVSSGNAHRVKEVLPGQEEEEDEKEKKEEKKEEPEEEEEEGEVVPKMPSAAAVANAANPLGVIMFGGHKEPEPEKEKTPEPEKPPEAPAALMPPPPPPPDAENVSKAAEEKKKDSVFQDVEEPNKDISSIVSQRLNAMRKLTDNPTDPEALKEMYQAQQEMSNWAASKNKPGQFTGHTGAKILSKGELSLGIQAWARQEQFTTAKKVSGGFGEYMLKKMGWSEGEGLGKDKTGDIDPLTLDIKMDKKGLISAEEQLWKKGKRPDVVTLTAMGDLSGKHPVSALMELATKRKWGPPNFTQAFECGPPHRKQYVFRVTVNGKDYQPSVACDNKKKAKSDAATFCLQELGLVPKDPNNPL